MKDTVNIINPAAVLRADCAVSFGIRFFYIWRLDMKNKKTERPGKFRIYELVILIIFPLICALLALSLGRFSVPVTDIIHSVLNKLSFGFEVGEQTEIVLWTMRFPRILMAMLVGAGLSAAGCIFQSLFSNPLATPDTLGVASGSSFGAALALLLGGNLIAVEGTALFFGLSAMALTWLSARGGSRDKVSIVLAGIVISSLFSALVSFVKFAADTESELPSITYWLMGSLNSAGYNTLALGSPLILTGLAVLFMLRWRLNTLPLSDDEAASLGINIKALRITCILCASAITAACVSMCGPVGWVGLLVPHICRMKFGSNHVSLLPASIFIGAGFMVLVDTAARSISASEIPVSILTAMLGAPFFIALMRKNRGWTI